MENKTASENNNKTSLFDIAKKKRQLHLVEKLHQSKPLSPSELKELQELEAGAVLPPGVVRTQKEVAKVFSVSVRTVQHWIADGMPKTKQGFYPIREIQEWKFFKDHRNKKEDGVDWDAEYRKYKAKLAEIELKAKIGEYIPKQEVEKGRVQRIMAVKRAFLSLPRQTASQLVGLQVREIELVLSKRVKEIVQRFAKQ